MVKDNFFLVFAICCANHAALVCALAAPPVTAAAFAFVFLSLTSFVILGFVLVAFMQW